MNIDRDKLIEYLKSERGETHTDAWNHAIDFVILELSSSKHDDKEETYSQCEECSQFVPDFKGYEFCPFCGFEKNEEQEVRNTEEELEYYRD